MAPTLLWSRRGRLARLELTVETSDITVQILRDIRDSIAETNTRLDHLYAGQLQLATEVHSMGGTLGDIRELFMSRRDLRQRVERCEREIIAIKQRIPGTP